MGRASMALIGNTKTRILKGALFAVLLPVVAAVGHAVPAAASEGGAVPPSLSWTFAGPFGSYDRAQLQRGFKVYREICSSCHSLSRLPFRALSQPGGPEFSVAQVQALAAEYKVKDGPNDQGDMFERPGRPADFFPAPFANDEAAKAANGGAVPPDFTVIAKARTYERGFPLFLLDAITLYQENGVNYIAALLNGYGEAPHGVTVEPGLYYNKYFPGNKIAMAYPLNAVVDEAGAVTDASFYTDGTPVNRQQVAKDVAAFLMWAAEPHMEARKRIGFQVITFLIVLAMLLYFTKKKVWAPLHAHGPSHSESKPH